MTVPQWVLIVSSNQVAFVSVLVSVQADEEQLLLEAIDMAGFGNWTAVSEHVGSKTKEECKVEHPLSVMRQYLFITVAVTNFPLQGQRRQCRVT